MRLKRTKHRDSSHAPTVPGAGFGRNFEPGQLIGGFLDTPRPASPMTPVTPAEGRGGTDNPWWRHAVMVGVIVISIAALAFATWQVYRPAPDPAVAPDSADTPDPTVAPATVPGAAPTPPPAG